jgi:outer membrane protein OmpA-like peptidoglycan-associated protein
MGHAYWQWMGACCLVWSLAACQAPMPLRAATGWTAEQMQILRTHGFEEQADGWALMMPSKLLFAVDTDQLEAKQADYVQGLAQELHHAGIHRVRIEGHTDDTGSVQYNQQLSERRAQRVADLLVRAGIPPERIETRGWGNTRPLPMVQGQGARRENRRVAIIIPAVIP